jgi:TM2 domain-containing membrane protein YozV
MGGKSKTTALLLGLGGGMFAICGLHRFYLGYTMIGLIQLFTCGGLGIWHLIDIIMLITGKMTDSDGNALS